MPDTLPVPRPPGKWREVDGKPVYCRTLPPAKHPLPTAPTLPVLLLHGLGCTSEVWIPSLRLMRQAALPSPVLAPDLPGYGRSHGPHHALSIGELADWCARFLDLYSIERAHIIGNSLGCQVALAMAWRHPKRVGGLVLQGPTMGTQFIPIWRYVVGLVWDAMAETPDYNLLLIKMYTQMGLPRYLATVWKMFEDDPLAHCDVRG